MLPKYCISLMLLIALQSPAVACRDTCEADCASKFCVNMVLGRQCDPVGFNSCLSAERLCSEAQDGIDLACKKNSNWAQATLLASEAAKKGLLTSQQCLQANEVQAALAAAAASPVLAPVVSYAQGRCGCLACQQAFRAQSTTAVATNLAEKHTTLLLQAGTGSDIKSGGYIRMRGTEDGSGWVGFDGSAIRAFDTQNAQTLFFIVRSTVGDPPKDDWIKNGDYVSIRGTEAGNLWFMATPEALVGQGGSHPDQVLYIQKVTPKNPSIPDTMDDRIRAGDYIRIRATVAGNRWIGVRDQSVGLLK